MLAQNGIVAWLVLRFATTNANASAPSDATEMATWSAVRKRGTTMLLGTIILPYLLGIAMTVGRDFTDGGTIRITVVQPNQNPWDKWRQDDTVNHIIDNAEPTIAAIRAGESPQMILWAENAIPYTITHPDSKRKREEFTRVLREIGVPVVTGFPDYVVHASKEAAAPSSRYDEREKIYFDYYNSIGVFTADSGLVESYHKTQLVPFGERVPFIDAAPFLADMLSWDVGISAWAKGKSVHAISLPGDSIRLGGMICFESVYPNIVRKFVADSARFLTIVTNDGWYLHTPGPLQHERYASLRAIETRRSIARAANTGISCFILPTGEIFGETEEGIRTTTTATIPLNSMQTFYVRFGNWLPYLCLFGAFCIGALLVKRRGNWRNMETTIPEPSTPETDAPEPTVSNQTKGNDSNAPPPARDGTGGEV
jgi:apolipoprotein N-acyltransferase